MAGNADVITDFNTAIGGNISDGNPNNNDVVDLSQYYNATNPAKIDTLRVAQDLRPTSLL